MTESVVVLGGGSWGATLADHLARQGHRVAVWEYAAGAAQKLAATRTLAVMPQLSLHPSVEVGSDLARSLAGRKVVVCAVPSEHVRATMKAVTASKALEAGAWAVCVSKGIENNTLKRMSEVIAETTPALAGRTAVLAGPSHAEEVCKGVPTAVVTAGPGGLPEEVLRLFNADHFRVYTNTDMAGCELGGGLKNVYAVACGVSDGLGLGDNTKAALLTRGLNEMVRLGTAAGGQAITFFGLTGLGDLIVTCTSRHSRNRLLGEKIGGGKTLAQALAEMTMVAEGVNTAKSAKQMAATFGLHLPLVDELHACLFEGKPAPEALRDLMSRPPVEEMRNLETFFSTR
jgi:glycerol-3-phosphate dehydrogenase (NAD(P)+)